MLTLSEKAISIHALESERKELTKEAEVVAIQIENLYNQFWLDIQKLNAMQLLILNKQSSLDETIERILNA